jgi:2-amino-4-hydroxy-6-hydroxymethyldihydropteridine diphosphokinase
MSRAVLALGSNLGEREQTILEAVRRIAQLDGVELSAVSSLHESVALTPHGADTDAPAYINAVALVLTALTPIALLEATHTIEADLGRVRGERWADRTLDIDLIDVDGETLATESLTLPHPRAAEREFVLAPWLELDPEAQLAGESVAELLRRVQTK